jgi:hypothetical protein
VPSQLKRAMHLAREHISGAGGSPQRIMLPIPNS